jgi:Tfp pilus assembly protein PilO
MRIRELETSNKRLTTTLQKQVQDHNKCKVRAAEALAGLVEAKKQIAELNSAVNFLLKQPPHTGMYFNEVCTCTICQR